MSEKRQATRHFVLPTEDTANQLLSTLKTKLSDKDDWGEHDYTLAVEPLEQYVVVFTSQDEVEPLFASGIEHIVEHEARLIAMKFGQLDSGRAGDMLEGENQ